MKLPVTAAAHEFKASDQWLRDLAAKDLFAVRRGVLKFRGWKPKKVPLKAPPTDADFEPDFEQKGVDMRIGLDMATFSESRAVDRVILVSGDTDCVPAMKHARKAGLPNSTKTRTDVDHAIRHVVSDLGAHQMPCLSIQIFRIAVPPGICLHRILEKYN